MRAAIFLTLLLLGSPSAFSATYYVPDDYGTVQGAIDASADGDVLIVKPGTYFENINFNTKAVTLKSEQGAAVTWIDGSQAGSVVTCTGMEGPDTILEGFTIYNGMYSSGGGMRNDSSSLTVIQCIFQEGAFDHGG